MLEKGRGRGAAQNPEATLGVGEPGGKGGRPLGVPDITLNGTDGIKRRERRKRNSRLNHLCCLFTFYFDFFAFPLSLDNETRLVSFIPVSTKNSVFLPGFLTRVVVYWVRALRGVLESRHPPALFWLFFFFSPGIQEPKDTVSVTDTEFCFQKENLGGFENGGPNQGDRLLPGPDGPSALPRAAFSSSLRVFIEHGWCVTLGDWFRG